MTHCDARADDWARGASTDCTQGATLLVWLAAQAGVRALLKGGNAVDAALTAAIALTVVEPIMNGIGGDMYAMVWADGELHGLNSTGRASAAWTPERFRGHAEKPDRGWDSVTVPGQVDGWRMLSERFGRLPIADLFEPAMEYAERGFAVSPVIGRYPVGRSKSGPLPVPAR